MASTTINNPLLTGNVNLTGATSITGITKTSVGLDQVNNTSDANKPISTATQSALNAITSQLSAGYTGHFVVMTSSTTFATLYFNNGLLTSVV